MDDLSLSFLRAITSLALTLSLVVLVGWAVRRYGLTFGNFKPKKTETHLQVIETKRLNQHTTLHLVRLADEEHLLATTAAQTTVISTRKAPKPGKVKS
ncbi:MAG: hypothetical protein EON60_00355 [Alphaproteobacteria bacterium]|nr:MAG: hypothetical protein EON60_00355 [Alphaproteobacteria bacterium]